MTKTHPQVGQVIARDLLPTLRMGTIVKGIDEKSPPIVITEEGVQVRHSITSTLVNLDDLTEGEFLVLWVPAPPPPKVGERVTLAQLEALPRWSVVIDAEDPDYRVSYQFVVRQDSTDETPAYNEWRGWGFLGDDHGLWQHTKGQLTLLFLPEALKD